MLCNVMSPTEKFPKNTISKILVCNKDECSYALINDVIDSVANVDFELQSHHSDVKLVDTLKLHFFNGNNIPILIAAGYVPMQAIQSLMKGKTIPPIIFKCNFKPVSVCVRFFPPPCNIEMDMTLFEPSCLTHTDYAQHLFCLASQGVSEVVERKLDLNKKTGCDMFLNLLTAHNMENQMTTHIHFQKDVEPNKYDSRRFYKTGISMTALAEALHASNNTVDDVLNMDTTTVEFTHFVTMVCQSFMRSAHICPYVFDQVLDSSLSVSGNVTPIGSESFKLPFREPFLANKDQASFLNADDCEGQATFMLHLFKSFQHMYEKYKSRPHMYHKVFPCHLFKMNDNEKKKLWDLAFKIGNEALVGNLRCDILLIAAGGAALGDGHDQLGGHATCVLVNSSNPNCPHDILMEGTNSMVWDDDNSNFTIDIKSSNDTSSKTMSMTGLANLLTMQISNLGGDISSNNKRNLIHLNQTLEQQFYKTAFCQNGILLATNRIGAKMEYGIDMTKISNYDIKVLMPVSPNLIDKLSQQSDAHDFLAEHCRQRRSEIHPPAVSIHTILEATKPWTACTLYEKPPCLQNRKFKTCLSMTSIRDPEERVKFQETLNRIALNWNQKYKEIGVLSIYSAFDTVFTKLNFWIDDCTTLKRGIEKALQNKLCTK